jgi:hypothetical protein
VHGALSAAAVVAVVACSQGSDPDADPGPPVVPVDVDSVHVMLTFSPQVPATKNYPVTLFGALHVQIADAGDVTGSLAILPLTEPDGPAFAQTPVVQAALSGRFTGGQLTLDPGQLDFGPEMSVTWERFTLTVGPAGLIAGGTGTMIATWHSINTDALDSGDYHMRLLPSADTQGSFIAEAHTDPFSFDPWLPTDALSLQLGEPADAVQAANLRVLADGVPFAGALRPVTPVNGLATVMTFRAAAFWPFGSVISTDPNGVTDPSGNLFKPQTVRSTIVADPGPITANLGFESELAGWSVRRGIGGGGAGVTPSIATIDPVEGTSQLLVGDNATVAGYFDVAADASSLSVSVALLLAIGELDEDRFARVSLRRANSERIVVYDAAVEHTRSARCECGPDFVARVAPTTKTVDLTPYRGERLFLVAEVRTYQGFFRPPLALVLDDLRIQ